MERIQKVMSSKNWMKTRTDETNANGLSYDYSVMHT